MILLVVRLIKIVARDISIYINVIQEDQFYVSSVTKSEVSLLNVLSPKPIYMYTYVLSLVEIGFLVLEKKNFNELLNVFSIF